jgi:hypothetical protein
MSIIMKNARQKLLGLLDFPTDEFKSSRQLSHVPLFYAQTNHFFEEAVRFQASPKPQTQFLYLILLRKRFFGYYVFRSRFPGSSKTCRAVRPA